MADERVMLNAYASAAGAGSCSGHSTREKSRSSGGSKTSSLKMSYTESVGSPWTVKNGPSSVDNSYLSGINSSSTDVDKEIATKAVALVVSHTRKGKTGLVSLCSLVGNILQAKLSLQQVVSSQQQEIEQLRSILCHSRLLHLCNSSSSSGSNDQAFGLTTVGTQTKGDQNRLAVDRSTLTSRHAEKPEQIGISSQTDSSGEETDSFGNTCPLIEKPEQFEVSSQTDTSGEETDSFSSALPLIEKPEQVSASSQTISSEEENSLGSACPQIEKPGQVDASSQANTSREEKDSSGCRTVFEDCQSCQTDKSSSGFVYLNCPKTEQNNSQSSGSDSVTKQHRSCQVVSPPQEMVCENLEQQLKTATKKILLLEKQISILKTELWVLRRNVLPAQQLASGQSSVLQPPSSNVSHPQQNEAREKDVETSTFTRTLLPNRRPMSPRQVSNGSSELPQLNLKMEMDEIVTYNQIKSTKHKEGKKSVLRSKKIHPALPHSPAIQSHTKKPCASDGLLECRCPGCEDTDPCSKDFKHNQSKKSHRRTRPQVLPSVGDRVVIEGEISGVVKYLGPIDNTLITYVGLHLDAPVGTGTGTLRGKKFFTCPRNYCKFAPVHEVLCVVSQDKPARSSSSSSLAVASRKRCSRLLPRANTSE